MPAANKNYKPKGPFVYRMGLLVYKQQRGLSIFWFVIIYLLILAIAL